MGLGLNQCIPTIGNQIRFQWSGLTTELDEITLNLTGSSLTCSKRFVSVGIEMSATTSSVFTYHLCDVHEMEEQKCRVLCDVMESGEQQPFTLFVMIIGHAQTQLCGIETELFIEPQLPQGPITIEDLDSFIQNA